MTKVLTEAQTRRLNGTKFWVRKTFDALTAYEMAVKLNTWLMNLAIIEPDPIWRDDPMTEFAMAAELVERLRQKVIELGWPAPEFPDHVVNPIGFAHGAWTWVWWIGPGLEMISDPGRVAELEMAKADAAGRH